MKRKETAEYSLEIFTAVVPMIGTGLSIVGADLDRGYQGCSAFITIARKTEGGLLIVETLSRLTNHKEQTGKQAQVRRIGGTPISIGLEFIQTLIWWECQVIMTMVERTEDIRCSGPGLMTGFLQTVEAAHGAPGIGSIIMITS